MKKFVVLLLALVLILTGCSPEEELDYDRIYAAGYEHGYDVGHGDGYCVGADEFEDENKEKIQFAAGDAIEYAQKKAGCILKVQCI